MPRLSISLFLVVAVLCWVTVPLPVAAVEANPPAAPSADRPVEPVSAIDEPMDGLRLSRNLSPESVTSQIAKDRVQGFSRPEGAELIDGGVLQHPVGPGETLVELARVYGLGFNEVRAANPAVEVWLPEPGTRLQVPRRWVLPDSGARIVINLPEMRLYHHLPDGRVATHAVGIGRIGIATPSGRARVLRKAVDPSWYVPASIRAEDPKLPDVIPPGPENPLGNRAVYLSLPGYLLHGTNEPYGIGRRVSHGCIRLYPEDVLRFHDAVQIGDTVEIVHQPVKAGWSEGALWLEVHAPLPEQGEVDLDALAGQVIGRALARRPKARVMLDWRAVARVAAQASGMPMVVARPVAEETTSKGSEPDQPAAPAAVTGM